MKQFLPHCCLLAKLVKTAIGLVDQMFTAALANSGSKEYQDLKNTVEKAVRRLKAQYFFNKMFVEAGL